jgi:hypothetical protein
MRFLTFDISDSTDGVTTLEAMASTSAEQHGAVLAEAQQVLDWAWRRFPDSHGPVEDGMDWDHDLQVHVEDDRWHTVTLTLTASPLFAEAFAADFGDPSD